MNYGITNELDYIKFFSINLRRGVKNFVFKGDNGIIRVYKNITKVAHIERPTRRSNGICNKADIHLIDVQGRAYPLSIKMDGVKITWESADSSLKHLLKKFILCYGRMDIPKQLYARIDDHDESMEKYIFGDDILLNDGSVIIQTLNKAIINSFNKDTVVISCNRVFNNFSDIENDHLYYPMIGVRKDSNRNKKCSITHGYRIEVIPNYIATPISSIVDMI